MVVITLDYPILATAYWSADGSTTGTGTSAGAKSVSPRTSLYLIPDASNPFRIFFLVKMRS